ncbi:hypothetical protein DFH07DRAFT_967499 [Mycena maculata]|uniref:Uncharacterized protein n=1 Tax=Mycena maculata TaxID=230809 RepID=A0AAD7MX94_9AGAR|nr:hypothetical protein DFH07DRAFT_967499 [Mycena maculata]
MDADDLDPSSRLFEVPRQNATTTELLQIIESQQKFGGEAIEKLKQYRAKEAAQEASKTRKKGDKPGVVRGDNVLGYHEIIVPLGKSFCVTRFPWIDTSAFGPKVTHPLLPAGEVFKPNPPSPHLHQFLSAEIYVHIPEKLHELVDPAEFPDFAGNFCRQTGAQRSTSLNTLKEMLPNFVRKLNLDPDNPDHWKTLLKDPSDTTDMEISRYPPLLYPGAAKKESSFLQTEILTLGLRVILYGKRSLDDNGTHKPQSGTVGLLWKVKEIPSGAVAFATVLAIFVAYWKTRRDKPEDFQEVGTISKISWKEIYLRVRWVLESRRETPLVKKIFKFWNQKVLVNVQLAGSVAVAASNGADIDEEAELEQALGRLDIDGEETLLMWGPLPVHPLVPKRTSLLTTPKRPHLLTAPKHWRLLTALKHSHLLPVPKRRHPHLLTVPKHSHLLTAPKRLHLPKHRHMLTTPKRPHLLTTPKRPHPLSAPNHLCLWLTLRHSQALRAGSSHHTQVALKLPRRLLTTIQELTWKHSGHLRCALPATVVSTMSTNLMICRSSSTWTKKKKKRSTKWWRDRAVPHPQENRKKNHPVAALLRYRLELRSRIRATPRPQENRKKNHPVAALLRYRSELRSRIVTTNLPRQSPKKMIRVFMLVAPLAVVLYVAALLRLLPSITSLSTWMKKQSQRRKMMSFRPTTVVVVAAERACVGLGVVVEVAKSLSTREKLQSLRRRKKMTFRPATVVVAAAAAERACVGLGAVAEVAKSLSTREKMQSLRRRKKMMFRLATVVVAAAAAERAGVPRLAAV